MEPESKYMRVDYCTQRMSALATVFRKVEGRQLGRLSPLAVQFPVSDPKRPVVGVGFAAAEQETAPHINGGIVTPFKYHHPTAR
jgi:hypothetical protein